MNDQAFWDLLGRASAGLAGSAFLIASFYYSNIAPRLYEAQREYKLAEPLYLRVLARLSLALVVLLFPFAVAAGLLVDPLANAIVLLLLLLLFFWAAYHVWQSTPSGCWERRFVLATSGGLLMITLLALMRSWGLDLVPGQYSVINCLAVLALIAGPAWILWGIHFTALHHAVFGRSRELLDRVTAAQRRMAESWRKANDAYDQITSARAALEARWSPEVLETKIRQVEAKRSELEERWAAVDEFSFRESTANLYEVQEFFQNAKQLEEDLGKWTLAILSAIAAAQTAAAGGTSVPPATKSKE